MNTTVFRYMLLRLRGQIIGWGLALAALALLVASLYDAALQMRGAARTTARHACRLNS